MKTNAFREDDGCNVESFLRPEAAPLILVTPGSTAETPNRTPGPSDGGGAEAFTFSQPVTAAAAGDSVSPSGAPGLTSDEEEELDQVEGGRLPLDYFVRFFRCQFRHFRTI